MGKVVPFKTVPLKFDIFLDETIVKNILKHTGNYEYAKEVILHELYHCQDMSITAKTLNANELFFLNN